MSDYEFKPKKIFFRWLGLSILTTTSIQGKFCLRGHQPRLSIRSIHLPRNPDHRTKAFAGAEQ
jgi:hypothetical protein